jgi:hypothetical protein
MAHEEPQIPIPRLNGCSVDAIARSLEQYGLAATMEYYFLSEASVLRAVEMWRQWQESRKPQR